VLRNEAHRRNHCHENFHLSINTLYRNLNSPRRNRLLSDDPTALPLLDPFYPCFPDPEAALTDPDGLLAIGGNLAAPTLLDAYRHGVFPWYEQGQPILWWSPSVRAVLLPGTEHVGRTMAKVLARNDFTITADRAFDQVIDACAAPRAGARGTWITPAMKGAYRRLHRLGHAHSLECWHRGELAGGLYGVHIGSCFCGESMFSCEPNAAKVAFITLSRTLAQRGFTLIDCQVPNSHLDTLGVVTMPRQEFIARLGDSRDTKLPWPGDDDFARTCAMLGSKPSFSR